MKTFFTVLSILGFGLIGYIVGYLSGAITGIVIYYQKSKDENQRTKVLNELDRTTIWDLSESD